MQLYVFSCMYWMMSCIFLAGTTPTMCTSLVLALLSVHCIRSVHSQAPVSVASQLTELQIGKLLNAHNVIRSEVSPHAADMLKMVSIIAVSSECHCFPPESHWLHPCNDVAPSIRKSMAYMYCVHKLAMERS